MAVSGGSRSFLSSLPIFAVNRPNATGIRAENTFSGVSTLPNCRRVMAYTSFIISPGGFSIGGRNVVSVLAMFIAKPPSWVRCGNYSPLLR